ncbi:MAG: diguanylate cyclase [Tissierellales bacterium]
MQLINSRYKIKKALKTYDHNTIYYAYDLWDNNTEILLKLYNNDSSNNALFKELTDNFIQIRNLRHKRLNPNYNFDIVSTIDNKSVTINQFFYTFGLIKGTKLSAHIGKMSLEQILSVINQLLELVAYIAFRGHTCKFINPDNIFIVDDNCKFDIKLIDFSALNEIIIKNSYDEEYNIFVAPEARTKQKHSDIGIDIYSIGILLKTMLSGFIPTNNGKSLTINDNLHINESQKNRIIELISKLTDKDSDIRVKNVKEISDELNSIFKQDFKINLTDGRNILNFSNRIIGRDKEINEILDDDRKLDSQIKSRQLISFTGEEGIGKTRLTKELAYRLRMIRRNVYHTSISETNTKELNPIIKILKSMIKDCDNRLIDIYGSELVKIIPEISENRDIKPSPMLSGTKERFRLYDRITKFIIENIKNNPTYIIIDELHNSDIETINLINYLINSVGQASLVLIFSYNMDLMEKKKAIFDTVGSWINQGKIYEHRLLRLNLEETAELIKNILGISYRPINFSTKVMSETLGNPAHIEEAIKNFVATGELFISEQGEWEVPTKNYTALYIPSNIEDAIKRQVKLLDKDLIDIAKYVSVFNTSVSKFTLKKIVGDNSSDIDTLVDRLVSMKILDERVEDWGFTYDFYSKHLKTFIYNDLSEDEKQKLHEKAAITLENTYLQQDRGNIDELIYHYNMSKQIEKAIQKIIYNAKKMRGLAGNMQCVHLWENAYELMKDRVKEDKLEVLVNLGNLYLLQGMTRKSISIYEEGLKISQELNDEKHMAIFYNGLSAAFYRRLDIELMQKYSNEAKDISERNGFIEELLESVRMINRINVSIGNYEEVQDNTIKYLVLAKEHGYDLYIGHFYNHLGIANLHIGQIDVAKDHFQTSLDYFQKSGDYLEAAKALNNLGYIYAEFLDDVNMAMGYFEEGIEISRKFHSIENELTFLNNIGEQYIKYNDHEKAKEYIERMEIISKDIEDENSQFLSQVNLCLIHLNSGNFDKCYTYFEKVNRTFKEGFVENQNILSYYYLLTIFYLTFGNHKKALENLDKTLGYIQGDSTLTLEAKLIRLLLKYYLYESVDKKDVDEIRNLYRSRNFSGERRKALLQIAHIGILLEEKELVNEVVLEDGDLKNKFTTNYLNLMRDMILGKLNRDYTLLTKVLDEVKSTEYYEIEYYTDIELGDICLDDEEYYKAVNHYLTALDLLYRLAKKIPDKALQVSFVNKNRASMIINKLRKVISVVKGNEISNNESIEFNESIKLEEFFNIKNIIELFSEDIYSIEYKETTECEREIPDSFEKLILQLSNNYMSNLDSILNYAVKKTFASRGLIVIHDLETDQLITAALTSHDDFRSDKDMVLAEIKKRNKGILVNKSFGHEGFDELSYTSDRIRAMICMPIFNLKQLDDEENIPDRRKETRTNTSNSIIGYLYLDTDKIFNRFDNKRYELIDSLSHLISINIDNHILKIISSTDKLTGVFTRKHFDSSFKDFIAKARIERKDFSVIMIDLDKFKNVNDTFGHRKGDEVLGKIGKIISQNTRKSDIVGRYGGEEFVVVLSDTKIMDGEIVAEKMRKAVEKSNLINETYPITISLGISTFPEHGQYEEEIIEKADQAAYMAKETGRNKSVVWSNNIGKLRKRQDKLAGIITGNTVKDQRIGLVIVEIIDIVKEKSNIKDKIFKVLGRMIEFLEAEQGVLITLDDNNKIDKVCGRLRFTDDWMDDLRFDEGMVYKIINDQNGEYFIDWEDIREIDFVSGKPIWQSVIMVPLINNGVVKGVLQLTVPIKEKEFDYNNFNFINTIGGIIAAML